MTLPLSSRLLVVGLRRYSGPNNNNRTKRKQVFIIYFYFVSFVVSRGDGQHAALDAGARVKLVGTRENLLNKLITFSDELWDGMTEAQCAMTGKAEHNINECK